jgi:putative SOS response-associated peptidase YedK
MCGNFSQKAKVDVIAKKYGIKKEILFEPEVDVYPWNNAYVVGRGKDGLGMTKMKWSLIPDWFNGGLPAAKKKFKFNFNAIGEELASKSSYKTPYSKGQRCIIFCDRFQEPFGGKIQKYNFTAKNKDGLLSIAGLWNRWLDNESEEALYTFTMITSEANALVRDIHPKGRMPLVLDNTGVETWLNSNSTINECNALVKAYPEEYLTRTAI